MCPKSQCSFKFSPELTAHVTGASYNAGTKTITITGSGFGASADRVVIRVGDADCAVATLSDTQATCTLDGFTAGSHMVSLALEGQGFADGMANVTLAPQVGSVAPVAAKAPIGTKITVAGDGFAMVAGKNKVKIGSQACTVSSASAKQLTCTTAGDGSPEAGVDVTVVVGDPAMEARLAAAFEFEAYTAPTATLVQPMSSPAAGGATLTINGTDLDRPQVTVSLGPVPCEVQSRMASQLTCVLQSAGTPGQHAIQLHEPGLPTVITSVVHTLLLALDSVDLAASSSFEGDAAIGVIGNNFTNDAAVYLRSTVPEVQVLGLFAAEPVAEMQRVIVRASSISEVQRLTLVGAPTAGTFTVSTDADTGATPPIAFNANQYVVQAMLETLSSIDKVRVTPGGGGGASSWLITFLDDVGDLPPLRVAGLESMVEEVVNGSRITGGFILKHGPNATSELAVDASAADVKAALEAATDYTVSVSQDCFRGGCTWDVTFLGLDAAASPDFDVLEVQRVNIGGSGVDVSFHRLMQQTQSVGGTFTLTVAGETTGPIAADATAASLASALEALASVSGTVTATRIADQPGKKLNSWYPYQWVVSFRLANAVETSATVCSDPRYINWDPMSCPTFATDLYLALNPAEWPTAIPHPAGWGSASYADDLQASCNEEAAELGLAVDGCQAKLVEQTQPVCGQGSGIKPPCWEERWSRARVAHRDGTEHVYQLNEVRLSGLTTKGYRRWQRADTLMAESQSLLVVNGSSLAGTGVGIDVQRRARGGFVELQADVTSVTSNRIDATLPPASSKLLPSYAQWLTQLAAIPPRALWSFDGVAAGVLANQGSLGAAADGMLHGVASTSGAHPLVSATAASFDASNFASAEVPLAGELNAFRDFTLEGWFRPSADSAAGDAEHGIAVRPVVSSMDPLEGTGYALVINADGRWEFWLGTGYSASMAAHTDGIRGSAYNRTVFLLGGGIATSAAAVAADEWVHVAGVYSSQTKTLQVYINGAASGAAATLPADREYVPNTRRGLRFGVGCMGVRTSNCGAQGGNHQCASSASCHELADGTLSERAVSITNTTALPYGGAADEVAIFGAALSASDLATHVAYMETQEAEMEVVVGLGPFVRVGCSPSACTHTYSLAKTPTIQYVAPARALAAGQTITLTGMHFDAAGFAVTVGGNDWGCSVVSATTATCVVPASASAGTYTVAATADATVGAVAVARDSEMVEVAATLTGVAGGPLSLAGGTSVQLQGSGFGTSTSAVRVNFDNGNTRFACAVTAVTATQITCAARALPAAIFPQFISDAVELTFRVDVSVNSHSAVTDDCDSNTNHITYAGAATPVVTSIQLYDGGDAPIEMLDEGSTVVVMGSGFSATASDNELLIGGAGSDGVPCTSTAAHADGSGFNCTTSAGPGGRHEVRVTVDGSGVGVVQDEQHKHLAQAVVATGVTPAVGSLGGGTSLTITGRGLAARGVSVRVGARECRVSSASATSITCRTPAAPPAPAAGRRLAVEAGAAHVTDISVSVGDVMASAMFMYTYNASATPAVTSVTQTATAVTVGMEGIDELSESNLTVTVGGGDCSITSFGTTSITCTVDAALTATVGEYPVVVHAAGLGFAVAGSGLAPSDLAFARALSVSGVDTSQGSFGGGVSLVVSGSGFHASPRENSVTVCGHPCPVTAATGTSLTCAAPAALYNDAALGSKRRFTVASGADDVEEVDGGGYTSKHVLASGRHSFTTCRNGRGGSYRGFVSRTVSGHTCQRWTSDTPHSHGYESYTTYGIGEHNYCRNPSGHYPGPWCYTTTSSKRWEECDIPFCHRDDPVLEFGVRGMRQALRFTDVSVPQGATIKSAKLVLSAFAYSCGKSTIVISAQDAGNASPFTTVAGDVSSRSFGSTNATWMPERWVWAGDREESVDIAAVLQGVVNRADWVPGHAIVLMLQTVAGGEVGCAAYSSEGGADKAPQLELELELASPSEVLAATPTEACDIVVATSKGSSHGGKQADFAAGGGAWATSAVAEVTNTLWRSTTPQSWYTARSRCLAQGSDLCSTEDLCVNGRREPTLLGNPDATSRLYVPTMDGDENYWTTLEGHWDTCNERRYWGSGASVSTHSEKGGYPCCGMGYPARLAVDNEDVSFWRSEPSMAMGSASTNFTVALTGAPRLQAVELVWEGDQFAKAYAVDTSMDGEVWEEAIYFMRGHGGTERHELTTSATDGGTAIVNSHSVPCNSSSLSPFLQVSQRVTCVCACSTHRPHRWRATTTLAQPCLLFAQSWPGASHTAPLTLPWQPPFRTPPPRPPWLPPCLRTARCRLVAQLPATR